MPPFVLIDEKGNLTGFDIDVIEAIAKQKNMEIQYKPMPFQYLGDSVASGQTDVAIAGLSWSQFRAENYGLTKSYVFVPSAVMYKKGQFKISSLEDLRSLNVGGIANGKAISQVKALGGNGIINEAVTIFLDFKELVSGKLDAIVEDKQILDYIAKNYPSIPVEVTIYEDKSIPETQQIMLTNKDNKSLIKKLNDGIDIVQSSKTQPNPKQIKE
ncbi:transporter substrate-binding domain-containing protein [Suttonella ornithocola]|uniref:Probable amino-acid-binding protein yxeM n=1 Tax=Suttonella ornithocola TaxID=279832 RepID=A0A380MPF6_9GAMM|nr:transporter substrate-binding domain-containing protein [Suttonella ornithocola]SUO93601.1 Probable amino-acid-binding protein yxeM precursor [Suttonella ornithocola]